MSNLNSLKSDISLAGPVLRDMGASTIVDGVLFTPPPVNQTLSKNRRNVALAPDPESLRIYSLKQAQAAKEARTASGPAKGPAKALERMKARQPVNKMMQRLQARGLLPRDPNTYMELKKPAPQSVRAPKPKITATSNKEITFDALNAKPEFIDRVENMARPMMVRVLRTGIKMAAAPSPL